MYVDRLAVVQQSGAALRAWYGIDRQYNIDVSLHQINREELRNLVRKSSAILGKFQDVFQYGDLNRHGFCRILHKIEHLSTKSSMTFKEINLVEAHFFHQVQCLKDIDALRDFIMILWPWCVCDPPHEATVLLHLRKHESAHAFAVPTGAMCCAILQNNCSDLQSILRRYSTESQRQSEELQGLFFDLLEYSVAHLAKSCVHALTSKIRWLAPIDPHGTGNLFHRLTEAIGLGSKAVINALLHRDEPLPASGDTALTAELLSHIVHALPRNIRPALCQKDSFGRLPVHYAALYGLTDLCSTYLECMVDDQDALSQQFSHPLVSHDTYGCTALQLSVYGGHHKVIQTLVGFAGHIAAFGDVDYSPRLNEAFGDALNAAIHRLSDPKRSHIALCLVSGLQNVGPARANYQPPVYLAAQHGCGRILKEMLSRFPNSKKLLDSPEPLQGWTPLIVASVEGRLEAVKTLIQAGANLALCDSSGWTAKEHAAFRGRLDVAEWLVSQEEGRQMRLVHVSASRAGKANCETSLHSMPLHQRSLPVAGKETQIMLGLGPSNTRSKLQPVDLSPMLIYRNEGHCDDAGYGLQIQAAGANGPFAFTRLPILEDTVNDPWWFSTENIADVSFVFHLLRLSNQSHANGTLVASGVAVLKDLQRGFSTQHESLSRDYTVPLLHRGTLNLAGRLTFNFLAITPLPCPSIPPSAKSGFWERDASTNVVGHRGTGFCDLLRKMELLKLLQGPGPTVLYGPTSRLGRTLFR